MPNEEMIVNAEVVDELPWGPGTVTLLTPMPVSVEEEVGSKRITIFSEELGVWGDGASYTDALIDFAGVLESTFDSYRAVPVPLRTTAISTVLEKLEAYLPDDI
jgi:hypothetical protein